MSAGLQENGSDSKHFPKGNKVIIQLISYSLTYIHPTLLLGQLQFVHMCFLQSHLELPYSYRCL